MGKETGGSGDDSRSALSPKVLVSEKTEDVDGLSRVTSAAVHREVDSTGKDASSRQAVGLTDIDIRESGP